MKVLITNNHLRNVGGSETWTLTMATEMLRRGFDVDVFTLFTGYFSDSFDKRIRINPRLRDEYDLILINHSSCLFYLLKEKIKGFKIFTSHGVFPPVEQPVPGADKYVAISKEIKDHMDSLNYNATLILNPIDCEKFCPKKELNPVLKNILVISDSSEAINRVMHVGFASGLNVNFINKGRMRLDTENAINDVDLVVSLGRGCYEAMACGRNVIVYDSREYMAGGFADGFLTPDNVEASLERNCSGRTHQLKWDDADFIEAFKAYSPQTGRELRRFALEHFDVKKIADQYLNLKE